jgi:hypothetical protein
MLSTVLITGARAPASLEIARILHREGHRVIAADSMGTSLCRASNAVKKFVKLPSANREPAVFIDAILQIMHQENVSLVVPTCEEIFFMAQGLYQLRQAGLILVEELSKLARLHNKKSFQLLLQQFGFCSAKTWVVEEQNELVDLLNSKHEKLVLKPVFSRFASKTLILHESDLHLSKKEKTIADLIKKIFPTKKHPWLVQQFIDGQEYCTYSIAHQGKIHAHVTYHPRYRIGHGAGIYLVSKRHQLIFEFVRNFIDREKFSGQIAFDIIETKSKEIFILECNPRSTSGVHFFRDQPEFFSALTGKSTNILEPETGQCKMLAIPMLIWVLLKSTSPSVFARLIRDFYSAKDVIFDYRDPLPAFAQNLALFEWHILSKQKGVPFLNATTWDIEWNGET